MRNNVDCISSLTVEALCNARGLRGDYSWNFQQRQRSILRVVCRIEAPNPVWGLIDLCLIGFPVSIPWPLKMPRFALGSGEWRRMRFRRPFTPGLRKSVLMFVGSPFFVTPAVLQFCSPSDLCASFQGYDAAHYSLLDNISASLCPYQAYYREGLLTPSECNQAFLGVVRGKAPGSDGLPIGSFVKFWDVLGLDLVDVLNSCYRSCSLSSSIVGVLFPWFSKGGQIVTHFAIC